MKMNLDQLVDLILCGAILASKKTSSSSVAGKTVRKKIRKELFNGNQNNLEISTSLKFSF